MSVVVDGAVLSELGTRSGDCAVEVVGARDVAAVERGFALAVDLLREVRHPEEPADSFVHDAEVRHGAAGPVLWFDAADAEAYPGVLKALVDRVVAGLDRAGVTDGVLRAVSGPAAEEPPVEVVAAAMDDQMFLREQLDGFPWPPQTAPLATSGEGPVHARTRVVQTSSPAPAAEVLDALTTGLSRHRAFTLVGVDTEITADGRREVVAFTTSACAGKAFLLTFGGRSQLRVVLDPPTP